MEELLMYIAQTIYGNQMFPEIPEDQIDEVLEKGATSRCVDLPFVTNDGIDIDQLLQDLTFVRLPNTDDLVLIYSEIKEKETRKYFRAMKEKGKLNPNWDKPLADIPEIGLKLYSCFMVLHMTENGEVYSLEDGEAEKIMKYMGR